MEIKQVLRMRLKALFMEKLHFPEGQDFRLQTRIAELLKCKPNVVGGWIADDATSFPSAEYLLKIHEKLGISPNKIFGVEEFGREGARSSLELPDLISAIFAKVKENLGGDDIVERGGLLSVPVIQVDGDRTPKQDVQRRVVLQERVCGRRRKFVSIQSDEGNILIFGG